jgi:hypothetical protein
MAISDLSLMLAKVEASYATWAAPAPATDASVIFGYQMTPIEGEDVRRQTERGFHGTNPSRRTAKRQRHQFSQELTGAGTVDGVAHWGKFTRGCQFGAAVPVAATECGYPLIGVGDGGSLSLAGNKGNAFDLRGKGSRGNMTISLVEKQLPSIAWDYMGLHQDEANIITPSSPAGVVLPVYPPPVEVSLINTVVQLFGVTLGVRSFELNMGNKLEYYSTTATRQVVFGKDESGSARSPRARVVFELPDLGVRNFFTDIASGVGGAFSLVHGLVAGNIVEIASANAVLTDAEFTVEANRIFLSANLDFVSTAAGNDFTLKTK